MSTSNNNKTAERLPPSPLATAEQMTPSLLASNKLLFSTPVHNHSNTYTPGVDSPHSHPPHHEGMRDQSSLISSNHHSNNSNNNHSQNSNNNNTTLTSNNNNTASTISSPPSHPLHHQGSGGASSTYSSHSINYKEKCVDEILAFSPSPILCKVTGLLDISTQEHWLKLIKSILPVEYMPVYFASNNKAFHLAVLAWQYDNINYRPGAALEYLVMYLNQLIPLREQ